ncbi:MAG: VWA domain-containing protein [Anaerolineaceae bacterium]|nr:VWA domain-containing protein [Anaerolineaceae bacterium]
MTFTTPIALVLLLCIPLLLYWGWPRQAYRRARDITSLILRSVITLLLVLALAGAQIVQAANKLTVIFLLDVSDSMGQQAQADGLTYIRQAMSNMQPDDQAGIVLFGGKALVEHPVSSVHEFGRIESSPPTGNTNLEQAIRLALGLFPADSAKRIVVLSDGQPTIGNADSAAQLAAATGVEISYVPYVAIDKPEVQVTSVNVPSAINAGQRFDLNLTINAEAATPARVTVLQTGQIIQQQDVQLQQGTNSYTLSLQGTGAGFKDFQVKVDPISNDNFYQNNQLSAFSRVIGPPRVLLVSETAEEVQYLKPALEQAGLTVDLITPNELPFTLVGLAQYQSVILANVSATHLSPQRMTVLQSYVRDLGGGLLAVGGPQTYGPGGYFKTPLEDTLPVESQIKDQKRIPQLTIAYVIDRSGSMDAPSPSGIPNIELAKEAIIRSVDLLQPNDRAGVVSFDAVGYWIAHIQDVRDRVALERLVATLRASGGTDILAGMTLVAQEIGSEPSARKHIILLTDGGADPTGLVEISRKLYEDNGVTTSVIAIGTSVPGFLQAMANAGGGNFHSVITADEIPTIFTQETVLATRSYIIENAFVPTLTSNSPIMNGITSAPTLLGYVATTAKQTAEVILRGPDPFKDPLLASWQYGLGRSVAFTSDATARWGANWVSWSDFVRFWDQAVRWTITEGTTNNLESRVVMEGEQARLIVDARDNNGAFLNGLNLQFSLVDPNGNPNLQTLQQVAPGRYEATFAPNAEGAYLLSVQGNNPADQSLKLTQTTGWVMSYSAEYDRSKRSDGTALLKSLGDLTGGRSLVDDNGAVFSHNLRANVAGTSISPLLLLIAMLLLPFDIAVRRLIVTRTDLLKLRQALFGRVQAVEATSERMSTLLDAKQRARTRTDESGAANPITGLSSRGEGGAETPTAERPSQPVVTTPKDPGNVAGELLKKRKERK